MSTFGGVMMEFPDVRVDYFRQIPGLRPPLACFLSHIHSDHLAGLEALKSPFVYCSAATRELLLRLERYPHRLNFAQGILESRKQHYKHLKNLLKLIPLETPTKIELEPGNDIRVTLFDANHCTGAVMFLFEGNGKAVLYTGDIRSEPWFVNNLTRNPFLIEYTSGMKALDCIYLDTSNTERVTFPTKAEGLKELLQKVSKYPPDTTFHLAAWTFGYEEVWMALSRALQSPIHVDKYKLRLYQSLRGDFPKNELLSGPFLAHEGPVLTGYKCGNTPQAGCLTDDQNVRLHSCEKGMQCTAINENIVWIRPIITRLENGEEIEEIGVGGGGGDLTQRPELELDSEYLVAQLLELFADTDDLTMQDVKRMLLAGLRSKGRAVSLDDMDFDREGDELSIDDLAKVLAKSVVEKRRVSVTESSEDVQGPTLPRIIKFPYSRHSSYAELCHLVRIFQPKDVYPCTVDEDKWHEGASMRSLFGYECSATTFRHDTEMRELHAENATKVASQQTQTSVDTQPSSQMLLPSSPIQRSLATSQRKSTGMTIKRNSQGFLRPFDIEGRELRLASTVLESFSAATPSNEILDLPPGSEPRSLRRKAILDGLTQRRDKRPRLQFDGSGSSPTSDSVGKDETILKTEVALLTEPLQSDGSSHRNTPESDAGSTEEPARRPFTAFRDEDGSEIKYDYDEIEYNENYMANDTFFDSEDNVIRCKLCGHELWSERIGFCTGCREGQSGVPYFEILDPNAGPRPGIEPNELLPTALEENRRAVVGDYLDDQSSAYDSQDADASLHEEYEINSFIDDTPKEASNDEDDASSSDGEAVYRERYKELEARYNMLLDDYERIEDEYAELRYDLLGSADDSDRSDFDETDEDGLLVVDVSVPDPVVTELVLSQAQEQSQESEISDDRVRNRAVAFEAAVNADGQGWHNISLVSTTDNHTHEEVEL